MELTDRTVLVVGGAGYVGSILVPRLLRSGARVRVLDKLVYDNGFALVPMLDDPNLSFVRGDLRDSETLVQAAQGTDDIVMLAALVGDPVCKKYPELAQEVNVEGTKRLADALEELHVKRFVFTSTCSNYGIHRRGGLATEESELNPQSLYARTKIAVEQHLLATAPEMSTCVTVLRIATAYGLSPRMRFDLTVSQFTRALALGEPLQVYDADTWRPYCHVRDIAKAVMTVLGARREDVHAEVFNVGDTSQQFTKRMIVDEVRRHLPDVSVDYRAGDTDPRDYQVSFEKIARQLGFRCDHTVQGYVRVLCEAVRAEVFPEFLGPARFSNDEIRNLEAGALTGAS